MDPRNSNPCCWRVNCSVAQPCPTLCDPIDCSTPGLPVLHQLSEPTQTHVHWVSDAIQPSHPLSSPSSPTFNLSQPWGLFQWVTSSHQVASIGASASVSVLPLKSWIGLISFRVDLFDPLEVPWTTRLSSLLQHCSSKASILLLSAFLMVQLSHPYMTTGKTIASTRWTFVSKVIYLLFNRLFRHASTKENAL